MNFEGINLPEIDSWADHLQLTEKVELQDLIGSTLLDPLKEFLNRPGKNIRSELVELGFRLSVESEKDELLQQASGQLRSASTVIEAIHAGTLIIDDIQDGSEVRRNGPTLHLQHGISKALAAGNWLYFWALEQIRHMRLDADTERALIFDTIRLMTRGHYGQALDVGLCIDEVVQERVREVCLASMELKTGTLFTMAFRLGIAINGPLKESEQLLSLANRFGVGLQALDDIGNFLSPKQTGPSKRHEDLKNKRPTWVWAEASRLDKSDYMDFIQAVAELPDEVKLNEWIKRMGFQEKLWTTAAEVLRTTVEEFESKFAKSHPKSMGMIRDIVNKLENAYVRS